VGDSPQGFTDVALINRAVAVGAELLPLVDGPGDEAVG
jgi:hypothetical protein